MDWILRSLCNINYLIDIFNSAYVINLIKSDHKYVNDQIKNML